MTQQVQVQLSVFCDGGIGNRINALLTGLAIAQYFDLSYQIHWPVNNWCAAEFNDIFSNSENISTTSLKELRDQLTDSVMLLHDEIASECLNVSFASAYEYKTMDDFQEKVITAGKHIFFYPAIMPDWVSTNLIHDALKSLRFAPDIADEVLYFIQNTLQKPFHGLHLRRTDLTVGLTDLEVFQLVTEFPSEVFYVCSDDPVAEALASAHVNVYCRPKKFKVEKKSVDGDWTKLSLDDDGRAYHGNIQRGKESVIEATIDMLILAHSQIVGYSGSTFQRMARLIGQEHPLLNWAKPPGLPFISSTEIKRQIQTKAINLDVLLHICHTVGLAGRVDQAIDLLQYATTTFKDSEFNTIVHTMAVFHLNKQQPQMARLLLECVVAADSQRASSWLHLAYAEILCGAHSSAKVAMQAFHNCSDAQISANEQVLVDFLVPRLTLDK